MDIQEVHGVRSIACRSNCSSSTTSTWGWWWQRQGSLHGGRYSESYTAVLPDFVKLADAFGAKGRRVEIPRGLRRYPLDAEDPAGGSSTLPLIKELLSDDPLGCRAHNEMLLGPRTKVEQPVSEEGMVLV